MKLFKSFSLIFLLAAAIVGDAIAEKGNLRDRGLAPPPNDEELNPCFVFFFSRGCPYCAAVDDYIDKDLRSANVTFRFEAYDVLNSQYARHLNLGYQHFGWKGEQVVPTIFIGTEDDMSVLVGADVVIHRLLPSIRKFQSTPTACYDFSTLTSSSEDPLHWGVIIAAALVDSINPCAIAVLLILLGGLIMSVVPDAPTAEEADPERSSAHTTGITKDEKEENKINNANELEMSISDLDVENTSVCSGDKEIVVGEAGADSFTMATMDNQRRNLENNGEEFNASEKGTNMNKVEVERGKLASCSKEENITRPDTPLDDDDDTIGQNETTSGDNLVEKKSPRCRAFISGMSFIVAVFLAYYALGFGIFTAVSSTTVSSTILLVLGIFIIVLGAWNIKDFLFYDNGYNVEIPRAWRPLLKRILGAVTSPLGAFAAGFIVCLFELPCTGGPYLFILGLLGDQSTRTEAAVLLLYYNFIFVLPLIIINCLVFFSVSTLDRVGTWKEKYIRHLHLFAGVVLIILGALAVVDSQSNLF